MKSLLLTLTLLVVFTQANSQPPQIVTVSSDSAQAIALQSPTFQAAPLGVFANSTDETRLMLFVENIAGATPSTLEVNASNRDGVSRLDIEAIYLLREAPATQIVLRLPVELTSRGRIVLAVVFNSLRSNEAWIGFDNVFVIAGQSNASGRGKALQSSTNTEAYLFGNDYQWKALRDPVDSIIKQVDSVSNEGSEAGGSVWPLVASRYPGQIAFVPTALGGTRIEEWLPGSDHEDRNTLYGSMIYRARRAGKIRAVLWWLGETDAVLGTPKDAYLAHLNMIANAVKEDLGVPLIPAKLQRITPTTGTSIINDAIDEAWRVNPNVKRGPDLSVLNAGDQAISSDGVHINTNEGMQAAAKLWANVLPVP
jgi:carbohydrate esterase-like sialic acid-specific acetylesterase